MTGIAAQKRRVERGCRVWLTVACTLFFWTASTAWASDNKQLLVLHSYHPGLTWTDAITHGIETRIGQADIAVDIEYAYMDTKRMFNQAYIDQLVSMYAVKYAQRRFDAILASDDHAFTFLRRFHPVLFGDTPVVFCGVNALTDAMLDDHPQFTGILESFDIMATVNLALTLQPQAGRLVVICDQTLSGQANKKRFLQISPQLPDSLEIDFIDDHTMSEVKALVAGLGKEDIVLWLGFTNDREGRFFSFETSTRLISKYSQAPMYALWDFCLAHGIVGGMLTSGKLQGEQAADLALRILGGAPVSELPVIKKSPNAARFDYRQLKRYGLKLSRLPADSEVINLPHTLYSRHRSFFLIVITLLATMICIMVVLLYAATARKRAARALVDSKTRYENVFNATSVAFFEVDLSAVKDYLSQRASAKGAELRQMLDAYPDIVSNLAKRLELKNANPAALALFKVSDREQLNQTFCRITSNRELRIFKQIIVAMANRTSHFSREAMTRTMTGEVLHVILSLNLSTAWQNGNSVIASVFDITDRKLSEEALRRSEDRFRTVFHQAASGMALIDPQGKYLRVNAALVQLLGYPKKELLGRTWKEITHPDDVEISIEMIQQALGGHRTSPIEKRYLHQDGRVVHVLFNLSAIFSKTNKALYLIAQFQDITPIKTAQSALKDKERRYRRFFEADLSGVYATSPQGEVIMCNEVFAKILGFDTSAQIVGTNILDYYKYPAMRPSFLKRITSVQQVDQMEITLIRRDGKEIQCLVNAIGEVDCQGRLTEIQGYLLNITRMKSLENQLLHAQKMESIGTMAGGVAHDFNNLLMGIIGNVSLMLAEKQRGGPDYLRLRNIEQLIQSGSDLTRQLLGFAKGGKYEVRPTDLNRLVRNSARMFARTHKDIEVLRQLAEDLWPVEADRTQIDQVLYNLYLNAWQAMEDGGRLTIASRNHTLTRQQAAAHGLEPGKFVALSVTDTGMGMDATTQQQIFDPFFTTKERERGTGLGLASAYGIVKNHAGHIWVESEPGKGATFTILLPATCKQQTLEFTESAPELIGGNETIMLVDDEPGVLDAVGSMLDHLGYQVSAVKGGQAAIDSFKANHAKTDLVILDMIMPGISGSEVFDRIRKIDPAARVLLCSGYSLSGQAADILQRGCDGFIQKPFTISQLSNKLQRIFKRAN